ncbi:MAG: hypothetical protein KG003_06725 [Bacteroidetes bacterium]|nr:hypothetical protein [Bacteroidota bacterium]
MFQKYLSLFLLFFSFSQAKSSHVAGGNISYKYLGNNQYQIYWTIIRDCRGIGLDSPELGVYGGTNGGNSCFQTKLNGNRISITDISPRCSTSNAPCKPQNTPSGEGFESHVYTYTIDISKSPFAENIAKSTCCEITFYTKISSRPGVITTGPAGNYYVNVLTINFCNLKKCKNKVSNPPEFPVNGIQMLCCNQASSFNFGAEDPDGDKIKYKLTSALSGIPNSTVNYSSPFSYLYPLTCYCVPPTTIKCNPNTTTNPPRGIYLDSNSGQFVFTPTKCDEAAVVAVEGIEYRKDTSGKYLPIARSIQDYLFLVKDDCDYNKTPTEELYSSNFAVKEGDTLKIQLHVMDETFTPYQTIPDTPLILAYDTFAHFYLILTNPQDREKIYDLIWPTKVGDARFFNYYFRNKFSDFHCPKQVYGFAAIPIRIQKEGVNIDFNTSKDTCGNTVFNAVSNPLDDANYLWTLYDSTGKDTIAQYGGNSIIPSIGLQGKYQLKLQSLNGFYFFRDTTKTIYLDGKYYHADIGGPEILCSNSSLDISATLFETHPPLQYLWTVKAGGSTILTSSDPILKLNNIQSNQNVTLAIKDNNGCFYQTKPKTISILNDINLDLGTDKNVCYENNIFIGPDPLNSFKYKWNTGDTTSQIQVNKSGKYLLSVNAPGYCDAMDSVELMFVPKPNITTTDSLYCKKGNPLQIDLNHHLLENGNDITNGSASYDNAYTDKYNLNIYNGHFLNINLGYFGYWKIPYHFHVSGCPDLSDTIQLRTSSNPTALFNTDPSDLFVYDQLDILFQNRTTNADKTPLYFDWYMDRFPGDVLHFVVDSLIHFPSVSAGYRPKLVVTTGMGCVDSIQKLLNIILDVNSVQNNRLIINSDLQILSTEIVNYQLILFDAIGRRIFETHSNSGIREKKNELPEGVYYYQIEYNTHLAAHQMLKGKITITR